MRKRGGSAAGEFDRERSTEIIRGVRTGQSAMCALVGSGFNGVLVRCEVCSVRS